MDHGGHTMLTVCCVLAAGPVEGYDANYVVRLERMVRRYLQRPFRFVCFTDGTKGPMPCETISIPLVDPAVPNATKGIWQKVHVFNPAHGLEGRILFLDLDVLVVSDLTPIVDAPAPFALTEDALVRERAHLTQYKGRRLVRRFNSSVMVWDAGYAPDIFTAWSPAVALDLSTDQDWIGERYPNALSLPLAWFPRISQVRPPWPAEAKVILVKKPKNDQAVKQWPELDAWWGGW